MSGRSGIRRLLAVALMGLLLVPALAAFATAAAPRHSCCQDRDDQAAPRTGQQCCILRSNPAPSPVALAPARTPGAHHPLLVAARLISIAPERTPEPVASAEPASSPPAGPNCSSILRI